MKRISRSFMQSANRLAKVVKANAIIVSLDPVNEVPDIIPPKDCSLILVTQRNKDELQNLFPNGFAKTKGRFLIHLPKTTMTRLGHIKTSVLLATANGIIRMGDKVIFVTGVPKNEMLDLVVYLDTEKESEIFSTKGFTQISDDVNPEVFEATLNIALELATLGREGKPVGTIFVLGDEKKVLQLSKQMIINPFRGYTDQEKNILTSSLKDTLREFAAIDGAFVVSKEGLVLAAGRYLGAASDEEELSQGLGSRHIAAAGITALTKALAIVISESTGVVRIFKSGKILMEIEKPKNTREESVK